MTPEVVVISIGILLAFLTSISMWYAFRGRGSVTTRWVLGVIGCGSCILLIAGVSAIFLPIFRSARHAAKNVACFSNLTDIGKALSMYAIENDDKFPLANWTNSIKYVGDPSTYKCPMLEEPFGYTINSSVVGLDINSVNQEETIAGFDGPGGKDAIGGFSSIRFRHDDKFAVILFVAGFTRSVTQSQLSEFSRE